MKIVILQDVINKPRTFLCFQIIDKVWFRKHEIEKQSKLYNMKNNLRNIFRIGFY